MALTVTESTNVNLLLSYLLDATPYSHDNPPTRNEAIKAAEFLADAAHKKLGAGWHGRIVRRDFPVGIIVCDSARVLDKLNAAREA